MNVVSKTFGALALVSSLFWGGATSVSQAEELNWQEIAAKAEGQTLYWNAWGGSEKINDYIAWVGQRLDQQYSIRLTHVKVTDTADVVSRVLAEKTAGKNEGGSVDLVWINGENFASMKQHQLLFGPFTQSLPNYRFVDIENKATTTVDFTIQVEGLEAPWGMAKFNFMYDSAHINTPPTSLQELSDWAEKHPGRFTYPAPPDYLGSTFLKQALIDLTDKEDTLRSPVANQAEFDEKTKPLWQFLDRLHPELWRSGKQFPVSSSAQQQLLDDGEVDIHLSFNPGAASALIESGELPASVRTFTFKDGTIGNTHFVAIPYNSSHKEAAMVVANFLMSPEAQARKQDPRYWGDDTVLAIDKLSAEDRSTFDAIELGIATLPPQDLGPTLLEPHPSWMEKIEREWLKRYGQ
ncbi:ABC transporter substrate-binding protein [Kiloniella laminariae]|uniref:ABC transporter substrate-binding protein n=1 Tax=Kiloniella laminariae TaxID=454162 RepID=A0ABT4LM77_9PROT|nr:ABC transporter substrate-binding protein [Kiloniella laminariae]MCZ4282230.1 ABC transporter substrate-binding protein [Kiloniella laminariae]